MPNFVALGCLEVGEKFRGGGWWGGGVISIAKISQSEDM